MNRVEFSSAVWSQSWAGICRKGPCPWHWETCQQRTWPLPIHSPTQPSDFTRRGKKCRTSRTHPILTWIRLKKNLTWICIGAQFNSAYPIQRTKRSLTDHGRLLPACKSPRRTFGGKKKFILLPLPMSFVCLAPKQNLRFQSTSFKLFRLVQSTSNKIFYFLFLHIEVEF